MMLKLLRRLLTGVGILLLAAAGAYLWFLHAPVPEPPRLSAPVVHDSLLADGRVRRYTLYAPAELAAGAPLVLALHGSMGTAAQMRQATGYGFERLADHHGFVVVYPQGYGGHWNDCRRNATYSARNLGIDDVGYLRSLIDRMHASYGVDAARVFAVGYSNGGHMSFRLALEAPELVRAIAAVGASLPAPENFDCATAPGATPVLLVNGTADPISPYEGGRVTIFGFGDRGHVLSAHETAAWFARRNGTLATAVTERLAQSGGGATSAERTVWASGGSAEVMLLTIRNGGHTIPQPHGRAPRILGRTHHALDASAEIWRFFAQAAP